MFGGVRKFKEYRISKGGRHASSAWFWATTTQQHHEMYTHLCAHTKSTHATQQNIIVAGKYATFPRCRVVHAAAERHTSEQQQRITKWLTGKMRDSLRDACKQSKARCWLPVFFHTQNTRCPPNNIDATHVRVFARANMPKMYSRHGGVAVVGGWLEYHKH